MRKFLVKNRNFWRKKKHGQIFLEKTFDKLNFDNFKLSKINMYLIRLSIVGLDSASALIVLLFINQDEGGINILTFYCYIPAK